MEKGRKGEMEKRRKKKATMNVDGHVSKIVFCALMNSAARRQGVAARFTHSAIAGCSVDEPALGALLALANELGDAHLVEEVATGQRSKVLANELKLME